MTSLDDRLFDHPYEFEFFQAVKLLSLMLPDRPGVGGLATPSEEIVRFKVHQSLQFAASSIDKITKDTDPPSMFLSFFGLTGVQGLLPHFYTEHILARAQAKDFAMADFFDLFNHRLISLFYRAWEKHHLPVRYQLSSATARGNDCSQYLFDLIGLGTAKLRNRMAVSDEGLLRYGGLFRQLPASATGLRGILREHFGVPVEIDQFQGAWYRLQDEDRCDLDGDSLNNKLGEGAIAGDAVWDPQARIRIRIGPLTLERFLTFLPDGDAVRELNDLTRFYVGAVIQYDLQLVLKGDEVPVCQLGDESAIGPRPGWCAWLGRDADDPDAGDAVFDLN